MASTLGHRRLAATERSTTVPESNSNAVEAQKKEKKDKAFDIIVNAEEKTVDDENVSFEEVTKLAYPTPPFAETMFTVTYRNAKKPKEGTLVEGQSVEVKNHGTIFNVKATDKS
jgi:cobalamin biosynthesis protein CobT